MPVLAYFNRQQLACTVQALRQAEQITADHYRLAPADWGSLNYDLMTLASLRQEEITDEAFAQISRYQAVISRPPHGSRPFDFFRICVQDHKILEAVERRGDGLSLEPLLLYVLTHELIHLIRFARHPQRFDLPSEARPMEEGGVHRETYRILQPIQIPGLHRVLQCYRDYHSGLCN